MASMPTKLLTGNENVDSWSERTWETVLKDTRIVVSTPAVLHDALCHAYVGMDMLALLVFDEAHNCAKKAPARRIMMDFYHPRRETGPIPAILGLSATPSIRAQSEGLEAIEQTLDARCVTPTIHREELLKHANRPKIRAVEFSLTSYVLTPAINSLREVWHGLDIRDDPYIIFLLQDMTAAKEQKLRRAINENITYCQKQLNGLFNRSLQLARELGIWASDRYLRRVISEYMAKIHKNHEYFDQWTSEEKVYLGKALAQVQVPEPSEVPSDLSRKASLLIQELLAAAANKGDSPVCVVFARERATVSMLYELLTASTNISENYRIGAVVGVSKHSSNKRDIYDLLSNSSDLSVLTKFRSGAINLLIATSVLEEGIDVPACNLVICFDELETFKSFIQRRGRARMRESSLVVFFERGGRITQQWQAMEEEMKRLYQDEEREHQEVQTMEENGDEDGADMVLRVESTGARIGLDEAKSHLYHFCSKLSRGEFLDARPSFITQEHYTDRGTLLTCKVVLPTFLPANVREAESSRRWATEKNALKDASLQAYIKLYDAGLVSDRLLPYTPREIPGVEGRAAITTVEHSFNPWMQVAHDWGAGRTRWAYTFTCFDETGNVFGEYDVILPAELPQPPDIMIHRTTGVVWTLQMSAGRKLSDDEEVPDHTFALLACVFGHRWTVLDKPQVIQICVRGSNGPEDISQAQIGARAFDPEKDQNQQYMIRDITGLAFMFQELLPWKPPVSLVSHIFEDYELAPENEPYISLAPWTKRADLLHPDPNPTAKTSTKPYNWILPQNSVMVDDIPIRHVQFGMLIPPVVHELEVMLTVKHLTENLLEPIGFSNTQLVREAISSRASQEPYEYERLENLGDSILKYAAAIQAISARKSII